MFNTRTVLNSGVLSIMQRQLKRSPHLPPNGINTNSRSDSIVKMSTPMNRFIINLVAFLHKRWKLLIPALVFIYFLHLVYDYLQNISLVNDTVYHFQPIAASDPLLLRGRFYHPQCMKRWIDLDKRKKEEIFNYIQSKFQSYESMTFLQSSPNTHNCQDHSQLTPRFAVSEGREEMFDRFNFFAEFYMRVYSLLLWQKSVFSLNNQSCIHQLQLSSSNYYLWKELNKPSSWMRSLILKVNTEMQYNTITSDLAYGLYPSTSFRKSSLKATERYFIHPSDATLLSSVILKKDPCELAGKAEAVAGKDLNILIINRKFIRAIHNIDNVTNLFKDFQMNPSALHQAPPQHLFNQSHFSHLSSEGKDHHRHHSQKQGIGKISTIYFEEKRFFEQVEEFNQADVVVSIHGSQLTNFVFMKPCSIIIEVMPWLYDTTSDYHRFSRTADVLHYSWTVGPTESSFYWTSGADPFRKQPCRDYRQKYLKLYDTRRFSDETLSEVCTHDSQGECRSCAKNVASVQINSEKLKSYILLALRDRRKCIADHPFYNHR